MVFSGNTSLFRPRILGVLTKQDFLTQAVVCSVFINDFAFESLPGFGGGLKIRHTLVYAKDAIFHACLVSFNSGVIPEANAGITSTPYYLSDPALPVKTLFCNVVQEWRDPADRAFPSFQCTVSRIGGLLYQRVASFPK